MLKVVYITSGKIGIHRFTFNELVELEKKGLNFVLCLTQLKDGPWMPLKNWQVVVASKKNSFLGFLFLFLTKPRLLTKLLRQSKKESVIAYFFIALSLYVTLRKEKISSIHCQMGDDKLYIGYFLKELLKLRLTVTIHAHELYQRKFYENKSVVQSLFSNCDKVITISKFNAEILEKDFKVNQNKIQLMRLFPDIDYKNKVLNKTKILIVANWAEKKGYRVLFEALKEINRNDFVLWIVGASYFSDNSIDLYKLIEEYDLENKVALLGRQNGVLIDILFESCDIFCLPSFTEYYKDGYPAEREGIPVALMEAMAWGKPVITTRHAGIPELVNEILVEERNVEELRDAIVYLLDHKELWKKMGEKNKSIINKSYSKKNVDVLYEILSQW